MNENDKRHISKFLSLVLRHQPEEINIVLDSNGYVSVKELITKINQQKKFKYLLTKEMLDEVVDTNNKKRFAYNEDGSKIRASQGHSVNVNLSYVSTQPPDILYHGTSTKSLDSIFINGLQKQNRLHVHLSDNYQTANDVGSRHGKPVVLKVDSKTMFNDGIKFYRSDNGVWLVDEIPTEYISLV